MLALGKGKIVKRNWVTECFAQRRRLSWRRYALDSKETSQPDSEDEIQDLATKSIGKISFGTPANDDGKQTIAWTKKPIQHSRKFIIFPDSTVEDVLNQYDLRVPKSPSIHESGSDTEIDNSPMKVSQPGSKSSYDVPDIYDVSTDEDVPKK